MSDQKEAVPQKLFECHQAIHNDVMYMREMMLVLIASNAIGSTIQASIRDHKFVVTYEGKQRPTGGLENSRN